MKLYILKYFSVSFLIMLFIFSGLETILPLFSGCLSEKSRQEIRLTPESENDGEKATEKPGETKEYPVHFYNDRATSGKYILLSLCNPAVKIEFIKQVIIPIATPPPELID